MMTLHEKLSHVKSGCRILACILALGYGVGVLAVGLAVAEVVGIAEEVFGA